MIIKFIQDSWRKFKRNEYLINVCKLVRDSSLLTSTFCSTYSAKTAIRIGGTLTFLYFDLYLYSAYTAHYVYEHSTVPEQLDVWIW